MPIHIVDVVTVLHDKDSDSSLSCLVDDCVSNGILQFDGLPKIADTCLSCAVEGSCMRELQNPYNQYNGKFRFHQLQLSKDSYLRFFSRVINKETFNTGKLVHILILDNLQYPIGCQEKQISSQKIGHL